MSFCKLFVSLHYETKQQNMDKQLKVIHLYVKESNTHHYFGSLQALCDMFDKQTIGIVYTSLKKVKLKEKGIYENNKCIIRQGKLITSRKTKDLKPQTTPEQPN